MTIPTIPLTLSHLHTPYRSHNQDLPLSHSPPFSFSLILSHFLTHPHPHHHLYSYSLILILIITHSYSSSPSVTHTHPHHRSLILILTIGHSYSSSPSVTHTHPHHRSLIPLMTHSNPSSFTHSSHSLAQSTHYHPNSLSFTPSPRTSLRQPQRFESVWRCAAQSICPAAARSFARCAAGSYGSRRAGRVNGGRQRVYGRFREAGYELEARGERISFAQGIEGLVGQRPEKGEWVRAERVGGSKRRSMSGSRRTRAGGPGRGGAR